jgi:hypothetical protein
MAPEGRKGASQRVCGLRLRGTAITSDVGQQADSVVHHRIEAGAAVPVVREDLPAHAGIPEAGEMAGDILGRLDFIRVGAEELADVVGHRDEAADAHRPRPARRAVPPAALPGVR